MFAYRWLLVAGSLGVFSLGFAPPFTVQDLGIVATVSDGGINQAGSVTAMGSPVGAFFWNQETFQSISGTGSQHAPTGLNDSGACVGYMSVDGMTRGFYWDAGIIHTISPLADGRFSDASDVNSNGVVTGQAETRLGNGQYITRAYRWTNGSMSALNSLFTNRSTRGNAINGAGTVVGGASDSDGRSHSVRWLGDTPENLGKLPGAIHSEAFDITEDGRILVRHFYSGFARSTIWENGVHTEIIPPGVTSFAAEFLNEGGQIVGQTEIEGAKRDYLFTPGQGFFDLTSFVTSLSPYDSFFDVMGINDAGQILGRTRERDLGPERFIVLTPVPEPATVVGLAAASGWLLQSRRRKRQR